MVLVALVKVLVNDKRCPLSGYFPTIIPKLFPSAKSRMSVPVQILHAKYNALVPNRFLPIRDGTLSIPKVGRTVMDLRQFRPKAW
jgi:hypothetical protein